MQVTTFCPREVPPVSVMVHHITLHFQSCHLPASLWNIYTPVCMHLCVCELRQAGKQLLLPFPCMLAAPVMAAPVWMHVCLPLAGSWRQGFLDAPTLLPHPLCRGQCLCQLQCSSLVPTTYLSSRDDRLGEATQMNLNVKAGAMKTLLVNHRNTPVSSSNWNQ